MCGKSHQLAPISSSESDDVKHVEFRFMMAEQSMSLSDRIVAKRFFNPRTVQDDLNAGLVLGIESVPDGSTHRMKFIE